MKGMLSCFSRIEVLELEFQFSKKKQHYSIPVVNQFLDNKEVLLIKSINKKRRVSNC